MTVFLLKITSDSQSFHFMVYERSDTLVKRFSFRTVEGGRLFSEKECYFVHPLFFGSFFFTHILCGIVYKEKEEQFKWNLVKNKGSFKYKMQKSDLIISKAWKALHMNE